MPADLSNIRTRLKEFDFTGLFIEELGWNRVSSRSLSVLVDGETFTLKPVAEKCGVVIYLCEPDAEGNIPPTNLRRKIEFQVAKSNYEHLIIFVDGKRTTQRWQWVKRENKRDNGKVTGGRTQKYIEETWHISQPGELLAQKIQRLNIDIEEEECINILDITNRTRQAFDVERVTKRFYDKFKNEHKAFLGFITGIEKVADKEWYASLMLNRMMFIYFIQKKGFLDNDPDYLRNRLERVRSSNGRDQFHSFYRFFLLKLFHEGLAKEKKDRSSEFRELLGDVPFLNGGLFDVHDLEHTYKNINIKDDAFEKLFVFFDNYQWHLDDRPLRNDNEINPDVLGYIFEKYINQKEMGAYYTKEDITGYISRNTIIPYLFQSAEKVCSVAFKPGGSVWRLLQDNPDRYIYDAMKKGVHLDIPPEIAKGIKDVSKREKWNTLAREDYALPTEIWREYIARRQRYEEVHQKLAQGEINNINDLITYNLDIEKFAEDVIVNAEGTELVKAFWDALNSISILDPTCGSGAFLFAALNILEPLYTRCLESMQGFVEDLQSSQRKHHPDKLKHFKDVLAEMERHPNRRYFILKSIIINNLYGVDIMEEAVEICKLRLFLKLAAQVENKDRIEPLPDIDFNIRAGNTLVGFASLEEVKRTLQDRFIAEDKDMVQEIEHKAEDADHLFQQFRQMQTEKKINVQEFHQAKQDLRKRLDVLRDKMDYYLAGEYGIQSRNNKYEKWRESHQPFHWFIEFYGIMNQGGFDVIIGNPPYVAIKKVGYNFCSSYFKSLVGGNLYNLTMERSYKIIRQKCYFGMIVPVSLISGEGFIAIARESFKHLSWVSSYSNRPAKLFYGVEQRLTVLLAKMEDGIVYSSEYQHWYEDERPFLFQGIFYAPTILIKNKFMPLKVGLDISNSIVKKIYMQSEVICNLIGKSGHGCWYHDGPTYWIRALPFQPVNNISSRSNHYHFLNCQDKEKGLFLTGLINSSIFYFHFKVLSNCRDFSIREITLFRYPQMNNNVYKKVAELAYKLGIHLQKTAKKCIRRYPSGIIEYHEYYPAHAKPIIDEIDHILSKHYGFTDEELDYIINYDIKYRMGLNGLDGGEE
jgi:hypothetical protein